MKKMKQIAPLKCVSGDTENPFRMPGAASQWLTPLRFAKGKT